MSTSIEGLYFNPRGNLPISGITVVAQSIDGYSEGSATTDSNGRFEITGLTDRDWLAKATSAPPDFGVFYLLPNTTFHVDISSVSADQHHAGFIGLLDNAEEIIRPDTNDYIRITDDGVINVDKGGEEGGILALTIDQEQIVHGNLSDLGEDDHSRYLLLSGRSGGQLLHGGEDSGDNLTLKSTSHAAPGRVYIGSSSLFDFDETTGQLKLPAGGTAGGILLGGDAQWYRSTANFLRTPDNVRIDGSLIVIAAQTFTGKLGANGGIKVTKPLSISGDQTLTIVSGDVTRTASYHTIAGEGGADDDLIGIIGGEDGDLLVIRPSLDSVTITVKHNGSAAAPDNILLNGDADVVLDDEDDTLFLIYDEGLDTNGAWIQLAAGAGGAGHSQAHGVADHTGIVGERQVEIIIPLQKALPAATNNATRDDDYLYKKPYNVARRINKWYIRFESVLAAEAIFELRKNGTVLTGSSITIAASARDAAIDSFTEVTLADGDSLECWQVGGNAEEIGGRATVFGDEDIVAAVS